MDTIAKKVKEIEIRASQKVLTLFAGMYHSAFKGQGLEFEDLREYIPGDEIRNMSWSKTAQLGRPFVKTFREERDLTVLLAVDISYSTQFASHFASVRERAAEIAALIAFSAAANHDRVGLLLFSSKVEKYIPPRRSFSHVPSLIHELLKFEPTVRGTDVAGALRFITTAFKKRAICFLVSDFIAPSFSKELRIASQKHDLVAISCRDALEKKLPEIGLLRVQDLESQEMRVVNLNKKTVLEYAMTQEEEILQLRKLCGKLNTSLIEYDTEGDITAPLARFFKMRKSRR